MNGMYEELLEKLRKNNRMSGWTHIDRLMDDAIKAIEALQQENEQLQARVARMRDALQYYADVKRWGTVNLQYVPTPEVAKKALAKIDKAIEGKEDV